MMMMSLSKHPDLTVMWRFHISSDSQISEPTSFSSFSLSTNGTFGPTRVIPVPLLPDRILPVTSDLQNQHQMVDQGTFIHPAGLNNGLQTLNSLSASAASATPGPDLMETSSMSDMHNQGDPQNHQPCKYDLLSSVPCEYNILPLTFNPQILSDPALTVSGKEVFTGPIVQTRLTWICRKPAKTKWDLNSVGWKIRQNCFKQCYSLETCTISSHRFLKHCTQIQVDWCEICVRSLDHPFTHLGILGGSWALSVCLSSLRVL